MPDQPEPIQDDETQPFLKRVLQELGKHHDNHRQCVIIMHGFLELLVSALVEAKCKNGKRIVQDSRTYPHSSKLILLHELGLLSDPDYDDLDWLRKIRNKAAHEALFTLKSSDLKPFKGTQFESPDHFDALCFDIFVGLWNKHVELFSPKFAVSAANSVIKQTAESADYLAYTTKMMRECHLIADVKFQIARNAFVQYVYEHNGEREKIIETDGNTYVRKGRRAWIKSVNGNKVNAGITAQKREMLELFVDAVTVSLKPSEMLDQTQGAMVWRFIEQIEEDKHELITYEKSRERPKPDGIYPRFTFVKYKEFNKDELLLAIYFAQMKYESRLVPITIRYSYLLSFPPGTTVMSKREILRLGKSQK